MPDPLTHPAVRRVLSAAERKGIDLDIVTFDESTHTAEQAAAAVGGELGQLTGTGTRVPVPHERHRPWAAARLDLAARWPLPSLPLGLELMVTLAAPLLRDDFVLKDLGTVYHPPNVLGRAGLGLGWEFP